MREKLRAPATPIDRDDHRVTLAHGHAVPAHSSARWLHTIIRSPCKENSIHKLYCISFYKREANLPLKGGVLNNTLYINDGASAFLLNSAIKRRTSTSSGISLVAGNGVDPSCGEDRNGLPPGPPAGSRGPPPPGCGVVPRRQHHPNSGNRRHVQRRATLRAGLQQGGRSRVASASFPAKLSLACCRSATSA
jgi:hypothetical protein